MQELEVQEMKVKELEIQKRKVQQLDVKEKKIKNTYLIVILGGKVCMPYYVYTMCMPYYG